MVSGTPALSCLALATRAPRAAGGAPLCCVRGLGSEAGRVPVVVGSSAFSCAE